MSNNQNQGASIEAERAQDEADALADLRKAVLEGAADEWLLGFVRGYPFNRRTPAAAAGAGELPALLEAFADQVISEAHATGWGMKDDEPFADSVLEMIERAKHSNEVRAAIAADRAQRKQAALQEIIDIGQEIEQGAPSDAGLIEAGALRQFAWPHNNGAQTVVIAYDKAIVDREFARLRAQLARSEESVGQYQQNVLELAEELRGARAQLAANGQGEPVAWAVESNTGGGVRMLTKISLLESEADRYANRDDMNRIGCDRKKVPLYRAAPAAPASAQPAAPTLQASPDYCDKCSGICADCPFDFDEGAQPDQRESAAVPEQDRDPLYERAVQVVRAHNRASLSLVQRTLVLGYNRTARLFEAMEKDGVVSACDANGHRTVLPAVPSPAAQPAKDEQKGDAA